MKDNFDRKYILEVWGIGAGIFRIFCDDFFVGLSGGYVMYWVDGVENTLNNIQSVKIIDPEKD